MNIFISVFGQYSNKEYIHIFSKLNSSHTALCHYLQVFLQGASQQFSPGSFYIPFSNLSRWKINAKLFATSSPWPKKVLVLSDFSIFQLFKMVSNYSKFIFQLFKFVNVISLQGSVTGPLYVLTRALSF